MLIDLNFEVELSGFAEPEIDLILEEAADLEVWAKSPEDEVPARAETAVSLVGDLTLPGNHRFSCGDSRDSWADLIIVDGPLKPDEALAEAWRSGPNQGFDNTA